MDKKISDYVRKRDGNKCIRCGNVLNRIDVHHIKRRSIYSLRWDEKNLITLCLNCHEWAQNNKEGYEDFLWLLLETKGIEYLAIKSREYFKTSLTNLLSKEIEIDKLCQE